MDISIYFYREHEEGTHHVGDEQFELGEDTRHGQKGFRALRRVFDGSCFSWDEDYQFYVSLDDFYKAFLTQNYKQGVNAF